MPTRTSHRWSSLPGNFDRLHTFKIFASDNAYDIPLIERETWIPRWLHPYGARIRTDETPEGGALHFFLDDFRFEVIWNRPWDTLTAPMKTGYALAPDFSLYRGWPKALQIFNIYRNRWVAAFWQSQGIHVIPTVVWSDVQSYEYAFCGIPKGNTVAVSSVGVRDGEALDYFNHGYREMVARLEPAHVVFYGRKIDPELQALAPLTTYPTRWESIKQVKNQLKQPSE